MVLMLFNVELTECVSSANAWLYQCSLLLLTYGYYSMANISSRDTNIAMKARYAPVSLYAFFNIKGFITGRRNGYDGLLGSAR